MCLKIWCDGERVKNLRIQCVLPEMHELRGLNLSQAQDSTSCVLLFSRVHLFFRFHVVIEDPTEWTWFCSTELMESLQPVREAVSYRGLFTAGWFGVREKHCSWLKIYDRLRASEQAAGFSGHQIKLLSIKPLPSQTELICRYAANKKLSSNSKKDEYK